MTFIYTYFSVNSRIPIHSFKEKCAIRTTFALGPCDSCRTYFISENILTLPSIYISQISELQKNGIIKTAAKSYEYDTRGKSHLQITTYKLNFFHKNIDSKGPKIFNNLPPDIKTLTNPIRFFKKNERMATKIRLLLTR